MPDTGAATPLHAADLEGADGAQAAQQALTTRALGAEHPASILSSSKATSPALSPKADSEGKDTDMLEAGATPLSQSQSVEEGEAVLRAERIEWREVPRAAPLKEPDPADMDNFFV